MEQWRKLMNEGAFEEARRALEEAERLAQEQMEQARRQLAEQMDHAEGDLSASLEQAKAEIDEAARGQGAGAGGSSGDFLDSTGADSWRELMNAGAFDESRRAVDEAVGLSRARREQALTVLQAGLEKMRRDFERAARGAEEAARDAQAQLEQSRREFEREEREFTERAQQARAQIDAAERASG